MTGPAGLSFQNFCYVGHARLRLGMQQVPAIGGKPVAAQLGKAGRAPDVGGDAPVGFEQIGRGKHFAQDGARAEQLHSQFIFGFCFSK